MVEIHRKFMIRCCLIVSALSLFLCVMPRGWSQERFRNRNFHVRIAVEHEIDDLVIYPSGPYQVLSSSGHSFHHLRAREPYYVQITRGQPDGRLYRLVLREFDGFQVDQAIEYAKEVRTDYKLPVKVLRIPSRERGGDRILVTAGEYPSLEAAREASDKLNGEKVENIYEDRAPAKQGQVRLVDRNGTVLARDETFLRLVPLNLPDDVMTLCPMAPSEWKAEKLKDCRRYRGDVELTINEEGSLTAVNDLWVEYYLYSVVAAEMGAGAPMEALKAQAVAGRSEAAAKITRGIVSSSFFDFYDTAIAQVYRGKGDEERGVREAVDATRGEVLVWKGHVVDAVYSNSCGGVIADSHDMWDGVNEGSSRRQLDLLRNNEAPDLSRGSDAHRWTSQSFPCLCNPDQDGFPNWAKGGFRWTKMMSGEEFSRLADDRYGVGRVLEVDVEKRNPSGRVRSIYIKGTNKTHHVRRELEIRKALGSIRSTFFTILSKKDDDGMLSGFTIYGAGFGHGVGMCQMGAYMMGKKGYSYRQILGQYYKDVKIRRLYR